MDEEKKKHIISVAKNYTKRTDFQKSCPYLYEYARKNGFLDEACSHIRKRIIYTREILIEDAKKYNSRYEWEQNNKAAYAAAHKMGIMNEICSHMIVKMREHTLESLKKDAAKYIKRWDYSRGDPGSYGAAKRRGLLDIVCAHMQPKKIERKHTSESLAEIAKKYKTRGEFQNRDHSAYSMARSRGILDEICSHMLDISYSIPQFICKQLFDYLLGCEGLYNTRQIITPFEIDVFYKEHNLAIEYNGKGWHSMDECKDRDARKRKRMEEKGITCITLVENSRKYEEDVKNQIIENLGKIEEITGKKISPQTVLGCVINYDFLLNVYNLDYIRSKISECKNIKEFQKKYISLYNILRKTNRLNELDHLRTSRPYMAKEELMEECRKIDLYLDLVENHNWLYNRCRKSGILVEATSHMKRRHKSKCIYNG